MLYFGIGGVGVRAGVVVFVKNDDAERWGYRFWWGDGFRYAYHLIRCIHLAFSVDIGLID